MNLGVLAEILEMRELAKPNHLSQKQKQPISASLLRNHRHHTLPKPTQLAVLRHRARPFLHRSMVHLVLLLCDERTNLRELTLQIVLNRVLMLAVPAKHVPANCPNVLRQQIFEAIHYGPSGRGPWVWWVYGLGPSLPGRW